MYQWRWSYRKYRKQVLEINCLIAEIKTDLTEDLEERKRNLNLPESRPKGQTDKNLKR